MTLIEAGVVAPVIDKTYPLSETADAMRYLEAGHVRCRGLPLHLVFGVGPCIVHPMLDWLGVVIDQVPGLKPTGFVEFT